MPTDKSLPGSITKLNQHKSMTVMQSIEKIQRMQPEIMNEASIKF